MNVKINQGLNLYNEVKAKAVSAFANGRFEQALDFIHVGASLAWANDLGKWYDDELEDILSGIGANISKRVHAKNYRGKKGKKRIAYIASSLYDIGGHSEVLRQWVSLLSEDNDIDTQMLYITNSTVRYPRIKEILQSRRVKIHELSPTNTYVDRIKELINLLEKDLPDFVILFIHPNDVIAISALTALPHKPTTIFFNHADHVFWLGRCIIDYLIEFRKKGSEYSQKFRKIENSYVIPLTTDIKPKQAPKKSFNIPENSTLSISIGGFYKVLLDPKINYFETIEKILKRFPNHYHIFVTTPPKTFEQYLTSDPDIRKRFIITGPFSDLSPIYGIADLLIETFPYAGGTVLVEAMACKLPVVSYDNKRYPTDIEGLPSNYPFVASTEDEVINCSSLLIKESILRRKMGEKLYNHYRQNIAPEKVHELLRNILRNNSRSTIVSRGSEQELDYNFGYKRFLRSGDFAINEKIFRQSASKRSSFSFNQRLQFYIKALRNKEFESKKIALRGAIFLLFGWRVAARYKQISPLIRMVISLWEIKVLKWFRKLAKESNKNKQGDQAAFYLTKEK